MFRSRSAVVVLVLVSAALAPPSFAQIDFGNTDLGQIRTACQVLCFSQTPDQCNAAGAISSLTVDAPFFIRGVRRGPASQDLCNNPGLAQAVSFPVTLQAGEALLFDIDFVADDLGPVDRLLRIDGDPFVPVQANVLPAPPCSPSATDTLCLLDERFTVRATWRNRFGPRGKAPKVQNVQSDDSGLFYFINPDNWEMLVKMVDACNPTFNRFWVFYAATTDVEFTVTVTDTEEQEVSQYFNPLGQPAPPVQDTNAFATCP